MDGGKEVGLTQTIPIFTSFGASTPDPWIHRGIHRHFTPRIILFPYTPRSGLVGPTQAAGTQISLYAFPLLNITPSVLPGPFPPPQDQATKRLGPGDWRGRRKWWAERDTVMDSISEASSAGPGHCGTIPPQLLPLREVSS